MRLARVSINGETTVMTMDKDGTYRDVSSIVGEAGLPAVFADQGMRRKLNEARPALPIIAADDFTWLTPIDEPRRILCVGFNYANHATEMNQEPPAHPTLFVRLPSSIVAHEQPINRPIASDSLDWEGEVAVIVGKSGRAIPKESAWEHIAGYTAFADNTIREFQMHSSQATAGKNFDSTGSYGPWIVSSDEVGNPEDLKIATFVNGEKHQDGSLADLIFDIPTLINYVSTWTTLEPGDIIATGTPSGIGYRMDPPRYLKDGDEVIVEIPGLVVLRNIVRTEAIATHSYTTSGGNT